ncbi:YdeI/OmpD-associated family protein [Mucilaginibacter sp. KACC 22773]|uniref:YdeI/OmpD-associated family protein n=1 Tax=Mucilaginibacter sp. KACC 22773 TaxID=3025671 RepID=UPI002366138D|nr:YdeI/OmpD-associated family protein [Mucilaginibacter sp. KACC 22773]WDF77341.1 YdeI/OmpD-associated family protein [Mucilaginibacter sp. KACC 22773]
MNYNPAVDAYINNSEDFAKPILEHWRRLIHEHCPNAEEAIKWSLPHFEYNNDNMCVVASYKNHCSFTFLKAELMTDPRLKASKALKPIQRFLGKISQISDLPPDDEFIAMLKEAMQLNEKGIRIKRDKPESDKPRVLVTPDYLLAALVANPKAKEVFESKSNSFRKEYIVWITDAKTDETRQKRINEALEWIAEGKGRFWKHQK